MTDPQKLRAIKTVHTVVWGAFVAMIAYVMYSGITGKVSACSWLAAGAVVGEGVVLLIFGGSCPLTKMARRYSNSPMDNFDIYLPNWLAKYNKQIFTSLFCIGLLLMLINKKS
ncbi:hypothetical protein GCM10023093_00860 [Nemorincola caseinilytica]|uniref:DUF2892 domain-containing protein n=1 Tax=Nemorincola caseinilytica TaxID=2054315 RepID=A0ABP8N1C4_9BACT